MCSGLNLLLFLFCWWIICGYSYQTEAKKVGVVQEMADKKDDTKWTDIDRYFCRHPYIDAAVEWPDGTIYIFRGWFHWLVHVEHGINVTARLNTDIHPDINTVSAAFN